MATGDSATTIRVALTVDDLFQWRGMPEVRGQGCAAIARRMTDAFAAHAARGVYAFSNTAPTEDDPPLFRVFDHWLEQGHHVGNHTHSHASLNWLSPARYIEDIEKTEALIARWSDLAPVRYFRHCFDMWGDTAEKRDAVLGWLTRAGYAVAPISVWFYDAQFAVAYLRALIAADADGLKWLRAAFVRNAVGQLRAQAAAARLIFGRDPAQILLIHGTAVVGDCLAATLDAFAAEGVQFVSLDEAMADPMNQAQPLVTPLFRNQVQKWAQAKGVPIADCPPAILAELDAIAPLPGMGGDELMAALLHAIARSVGAEADIANFSVA
ncbi:MAG TPA: polysaccharide deacetylase family protein [Caulobacteraceae bacterium]|jgi:peptidoglycan/xylan/chitin deacetylase (PgdA/CDA1 family)|nr:polysaccharide deacetylase family protein [Caulobacteraceae bacterium]